MIKKTTLLRITLVAIMLLVVYYLFGVEELLKTPKARPYRNLPDFSAKYNVDEEVRAALARMRTDKALAPVVSSNLSVDGLKVALTFDGLTDARQMEKLLNLLKQYNMKATFFVDALQTSENPQLVKNIRDQGHKVENYTFSGSTNMQNLSAQRLVTDFCRAQKIIEVETGITPTLLKCNDTQYTDELLMAARACGFEGVVQSNIYLNTEEINKIGSADQFVQSFAPGSIVSVKLLPYPEDNKPAESVTASRPAVDKQPSLGLPDREVAGPDAMIVNAVEKLLLSMEKAHYESFYMQVTH